MLAVIVLLSACASDGSSIPPAEAASAEVAANEDDGRQLEPMTLVFQIRSEAVWSDDTPISIEDFECTIDAAVNTPGSVVARGHDLISEVRPGAEPGEVVVAFTERFAGYRELFNPLIPAHTVQDCSDVSNDWINGVPISGGPYILDEFSAEQARLVPNPRYWVKDAIPTNVVRFVPTEQSAGVDELLAGKVDFIAPQARFGLSDELSDVSIEMAAHQARKLELLFFQQGAERGGPLSDPMFRRSFSESIDRQLLLDNVFRPIGTHDELARCALWIPGGDGWCNVSQFEDTYQPSIDRERLLAAGWERDREGFWALDGVVPEIVWPINFPNPRRELTQELLIPSLADHGFKVISEHTTASDLFQSRLPTGDFDMAMVIIELDVDPDRGAQLACSQIPNRANGFRGRNITFWCNEEASAVIEEASVTLDVARRRVLTHRIGQYVVDDAVLLPLVYTPSIVAWDSDLILGDDPAAELSNRDGFVMSLNDWRTASDQEIVIGAEQWPRCLNPITECNNLTWAATIGIRASLPRPWESTAEGTFAVGDMLVGEPTLVIDE